MNLTAQRKHSKMTEVHQWVRVLRPMNPGILERGRNMVSPFALMSSSNCRVIACICMPRLLWMLTGSPRPQMIFCLVRVLTDQQRTVLIDSLWALLWPQAMDVAGSPP